MTVSKPVQATDDEKGWIVYDEKEQKDLSSYFLTQSDRYYEIFTAVNGVYLGVLALFGLTNGGTLKIIVWPAILVFLLPIAFWIIGMYFFLEIRQPMIRLSPPRDPGVIRQNLSDSNLIKAKNYRIGLFAFGVGVLLMIVSLGAGAYLASLPGAPTPQIPPSDVQLIINNDSIPLLTQIPIDFIPGTNKTVIVALYNSTDTSYNIGLQNGDIVDIQKAWIQTVIWKSNSVIQENMSNPNLNPDSGALSGLAIK